MMLSQVVHTAGINWESLIAIVGGMTLVLSVFSWWENSRKNEVTVAVNSLKNMLLEKLETKENVAQIRVDIARLEGEVNSLKGMVSDVAAKALHSGGQQ